MKRDAPKDLAASVRYRLLELARQSGRPFNEVLQYFAMERFLYRLSRSPHSETFVLKGALLFTAWKTSQSRPTMDVDLLGRTNRNVDAIVAIVRDVLAMEVEPDGLTFELDSVAGEQILADAVYEGVRIRFTGELARARINMQLDIGFGDEVFPGEQELEYPTILEFPVPRLRVYTKESLIAEKFEAMVKLGAINSRMKDFHDIWTLSRQYTFDGKTLADAISRTFANRGTELIAEPIALTPAFTRESAKEAQWRAFLRRTRLEQVELSPVIEALAQFLGPISAALPKGRSFRGTWKPSGPWRIQAGSAR